MRMLFRITAMALAATTVAGSVAVWGVHHMTQPGPLAETRTVIIPRGSGLPAIARLLGEEGVVDVPLLFMAGAKLLRADRDMKAGEYQIPGKASIDDIITLIRTGKTVIRRFTVPEGLTSLQVIALLAAEPALSGTVTRVPANGSLLPETYHFSYGDDRNDLIDRMQVAMKGVLDELWPRRARGLPFTDTGQAVTMASIVEKETSLPVERAKVAGVFVNRLQAGMKLQSDPTVIYALTNGGNNLGRALNRSDWKTESPYNTYHIEGLPPGPIANPGRASIEATLNPERHEYLYFVADGNGGHAFAKSLPDHNRNVAHWRQVQQSSTNNQPTLAE